MSAAATAADAVAALAADVPGLHPLNAVPDEPGHPYSSFSATLGRGDAYTLDATEGLRWGRVVVQSFARTLTNAEGHAELVREALVGRSVHVTGYRPSTPIRSELDPAVNRDPDDDGVVGVTTTYTFTAAKET